MKSRKSTPPAIVISFKIPYNDLIREASLKFRCEHANLSRQQLTDWQEKG